ncbi:MAG: hypothetical protein SXU28_11005 [Pseudomonadota bacterium]|nr:hypothetical protein [Pseudomonadota bacterium]
MTFNFATVIVPAALIAAWLFGSLALSRGGSTVVELAPKALLVFGGVLLSVMTVLEWTKLTPRWIVGSEGYGIIIPIFGGLIALGSGLLLLILNSVLIRKIASQKSEKEI